MSEHEDFRPLTGGCACLYIRYKIQRPPIFIHGCHCRECQVQTGSAFVINILIESFNVFLEDAARRPVAVRTPSASGYGQLIHRCPKCLTAVWSYYGGAGPAMTFLRGTTLDDEFQSFVEPDVHIFISTKAPWVKLPDGKPAFEEFYKYDDYWPKESLERRAALKPLIIAWKQKNGKFWYGQAGVVEGEDGDSTTPNSRI